MQNKKDADIKISFAKAKLPNPLPYSLLLITFQKSSFVIDVDCFNKAFAIGKYEVTATPS